MCSLSWAQRGHVHADEISVDLWSDSHRRQRSLLCRGHRSYYDGHARQEKDIAGTSSQDRVPH